MAENSKIEWTTHTFNPWSGCTKVSAGCKNCYAEVNYSVKMRGVKWGPQGNRIVAADSMWRNPVKWNRDAGKCPNGTRFTSEHMWKAGRCLACGSTRPRVFCASLADAFEDWQGPMSVRSDGRWWLIKPYLDSESGPENWQLEYPESWKEGDHQGWRLVTMQDVRARLFDLIDATPNLDWLLLTKRPENIARMMPPRPAVIDGGECNKCVGECRCPRSNLWLGTSVENQSAADERISHLLRAPAAVRFLSCEPLLGPVTLSGLVKGHCPTHDFPSGFCHGPCPDDQRIHWVIVGGESGPGARPCDVAWIRSIVEQCEAAGVPCFVKQLGSKPDGRAPSLSRPLGDPTVHDPDHILRIRDKKGGAIEEWPSDLRVREFPTVKAGAA